MTNPELLTRLADLYEAVPELVPEGWGFARSSHHRWHPDHLKTCRLRRDRTHGPATMLWLADPTVLTLTLGRMVEWLGKRGTHIKPYTSVSRTPAGDVVNVHGYMQWGALSQSYKIYNTAIEAAIAACEVAVKEKP